MKRIMTIQMLATLLAVTPFSSCVRDDIEACPPLQVNVTVKDKNYLNVDKATLNMANLNEKLPDDLAFRAYVPTLCYVLRDAATGKVMHEQAVFAVEGDAQQVPLTFPESLPHGKYVLTVWGGLDNADQLSADRLSLNLHAQQAPGADVFVTNDTLVYDAWNHLYSVDMERTKGKLVIQATNLPKGITASRKSVDGLFGKVNSQFQYTGTAAVHTAASWTAPKDLMTKTVLAPSVKESASLLHVNFDGTDHQGPISYVPADVRINTNRNELTLLRYVYEEDSDGFNIYLLVDDGWTLIHDMSVEE